MKRRHLSTAHRLPPSPHTPQLPWPHTHRWNGNRGSPVEPASSQRGSCQQYYTPRETPIQHLALDLSKLSGLARPIL